MRRGMSRIKLVTLAVFLFGLLGLGGGGAHAANCALTSGASQATIAAAFAARTTNSCTGTIGGSWVGFGAGTYTITSPITIGCSSTAGGMYGPIVAYPGAGPYTTNPYQVTINGSVGSAKAMFNVSSCSSSFTLHYLGFNGGNPQPDGGGAFYWSAGGVDNWNVQYNYFWGNQGNFTTVDCCTGDSFFWMDGNQNDTTTIDTNDSFTWNQFGATNDCSNIMHTWNYQGGYASAGGYCAAIGIHLNATNLNISNNDIYYQEQGLKFYCSSCQPAPAPQFHQNGTVINNNDFSHIHRIAIELQQVQGSLTCTPQSTTGGTSNCTPIQINNDSLHDQQDPCFGSFGWSLPADDGYSTNVGNTVLIANTFNPATCSGTHDYIPSGIEWWGLGTVGNGLFQGYWASGIEWGYGYHGSLAPGPIRNSIFNIVAQAPGSTGQNNQCITQEESNQPKAPTLTANVNVNNTTGLCTTFGAGAVTSTAPTLTPSSGAAPLTVTVTDAGNVNGAGPIGNTGIWYTTDGSTPVPGSGTAKYASSGATVSIPSAGTLKAVGMWGSQNQPTSYAGGWGYVPSAVVTGTYTGGGSSNFFISPTGSDSNNGTSASTPWLSPNHAMTCGQTITALPGTYSSANFYNGKWGTVTCPAGNNVAWLTCQTFDACKINATSQQGMYVSASYWGISGWEITDSWQFGNCYYIQPTGSTPVHHVIFANDVANGCAGGGFVAFAQGSTAPAVDYIALIGDIAYGTGSSSSVCASGFSLGFLPQLDSVAGTHLYIAGSFGWGNTNPASCASTAATDGEGIIIDTLRQYGYNQQVAIENNIMVGNYGRGIEMNNNNTSNPATFFTKNNTLYGNNTQSGQQFPQFLGEEYINQAYAVNSTADLAMTSVAAVGANKIYAYSAEGTNGSSSVAGNWLYSAAGNTTLITSSPGFSFGSNITGTNPAFANPVIPGAPACGGTANTVACMATLITNFTPTASGSTALGYQRPSSTPVFDPLYPQWLCSVTNLPAGIVTPGCSSSAPTLTGGFQSNSGNVNKLTVSGAGVQQQAIGQFSDGSTHPLPFGGQTANWSSSNPSVITVTSGGLVTAAPSATNGQTANSLVTAQPSGISFSQWTWTVNSAASLTGVTLACAGGATTVGVGSSLICTATCTYSDGVSTDCSAGDSRGTDASFLSSNPSAATVNATGTVSGVAAGATNLTASAGGFTSSPPLVIQVTAPAPVLQGVTLNTGGTSSLTVPQTLQTSATCNYSGGINTTCYPGPDQYGTTAGGFASSDPTKATISTGGLVTAVAAGATNLTVQAKSFTSTPVQIVVSAPPPPATITGVSITGPITVIAGQIITLGATCSYSDGSTTNCQTTDSHGNVAANWLSSSTGVATINSTTGVLTGVAAGVSNITTQAGGFTSPAVTITVTKPTTLTICGNNQTSTGFAGSTAPNYANAVYCGTGPNSGGYVSSSGSFYLPAGTQTSGSSWDLVVVPAANGTTQNAAAICKGTYVTNGTTAPAAWVSVVLGKIGSPADACVLAASTGYWIETVTNEPGHPGQGFWTCGSGSTGACAGSLPTVGNGTYPYWFVSNVYGSYTAMTTTLRAGGAVQPSQYITLGSPPPSLVGGFQQSSPQNINTIKVGGSILLNAFCQYSDGTTQQCFPAADSYGNTVLSCTTSNSAVLSVMPAGSGNNPCLVTGISGGKADVNVTLTGSVKANSYGVTSQSFDTNPVPGSPARFFRR